MRLGLRLSKKRVLVAMLMIAVCTSLLRGYVSDLLRMPATVALAPVSDYVKASASAFKSAMAEREEPVMSASDAARLRKETLAWQSIALARARGEARWERECRRIQRVRSAYGQSLETCELIPARIILGEALPYGRSQTVAQGTIHGVKNGMRVIDVLTDRSKALPADAKMRAVTGYSPVAGMPISGSVLIGWVEAAGSFTARVRLVTDKRFKIKANLWRTLNPPRKAMLKTSQGLTERILTIQDLRNRDNNIVVTLSGDGERGLITSDIQKGHNIRVGDWLWTTGRSAKLPVEMRIGKIVSIEPAETPNFVIAKVAPSAELGALRDIFIVRSLVSQLTPSQGGN